jgi:CRISPR/Cas system Type II protein with McrA/HNH and RuvC-like nuclease domain
MTTPPQQKRASLLKAFARLNDNLRGLNDFIAQQGADTYARVRGEKDWQVRKQQLYQQQKGRCTRCQNYFLEVDLQMDHVLPKSKYVTLADELENFQLLCPTCNTDKSNRMPYDWELAKLLPHIRDKAQQ